jgi:hypothetical protein
LKQIALKVVEEGTVFCGERGSNRQSATFAGICVLPSGRWLCTWRAAPVKSAVPGQHTLLSWSDDQGRSWSQPVEPFPATRFRGKPGALRAGYVSVTGERELAAVLCWVDASKPSLPFFNEKTEGLLDTRIFLSRSSDGGQTWSEPEWVDTAPFDCPTPITGPMLILPDGRCVCQFELNKHYDDESVWSHRSILLFSEDHGHSWPQHQVASEDPENRVFYWDQRPGVLHDGGILDLFWTYDRQASAYLNIHARSARGNDWSSMWDTGVPGQPAAPVQRRDGSICLVYVDRTAAPVIKARLSTDRGRTWPAASENTIYSSGRQQTIEKRDMRDAWKEMGQFSLGLPATALLSDDDILVVYYAGPQTDLTAIRWARLTLDTPQPASRALAEGTPPSAGGCQG